jgi:predicted dehydrogenase
MKNNIKVAIIGAGYTANEHAKAFNDIANVSLVGIYTRLKADAMVFANTHKVHNVYDSIEELYTQTQADIVIVTVNEPSMMDICLDCMNFEWVLFIEKPPGMFVAQAERLVEKANNENRHIFVALNRRFYHSTQTALADLNNIDEPRYVVVQDQQDREAARAKVGRPEDVIHYWMYANAIHMVDFVYIFGRGNIIKTTPIFPWSSIHPRVVTIAFEFDSGDKVLYEGIWEAPAPWSVSITTSQKRWELRPVEDVTYQPAGERQRYPIERSAWDTNFKPGYRGQAQAVVDFVLGKESEAIPLSHAIETMYLIEKIYGR